MSRCDWHSCAQCRAVPEFFTDDSFRATTIRTTRGRRVNFSINGRPNLMDWSADYAREIARRLLDAADEVEELDWKERDK